MTENIRQEFKTQFTQKYPPHYLGHVKVAHFYIFLQDVPDE